MVDLVFPFEEADSFHCMDLEGSSHLIVIVGLGVAARASIGHFWQSSFFLHVHTWQRVLGPITTAMSPAEL